MKTKDIIYEAINSVKHEYEPAKYLHIEELEVSSESDVVLVKANKILSK